jgi:hypothetical protein
MKEATVEAQPTYDALDLTHEVYRLLLAKGLPVDREAGDLNAAVAGASQILRWLGIEPVVDAQLNGYRQLDYDGQLAYNRRIHGD